LNTKSIIGEIMRDSVVTGLVSILALGMSFVSPVESIGGSSSERNRLSINGTEIPHLYVYSEKYILGCCEKAGFSNLSVTKIERNGDGTVLYLHGYDHSSGDSMILSVSSGAVIKKLVPPARFGYLDNRGKFVAWYEEKTEGIHFENGTIQPGSGLLRFGVDPSGQLFFLNVSEKLIQIARTDEPEKPLFYTNIDVEKMFFSQDRIYLFSRYFQDPTDISRNKKYRRVCHIYQNSGDGFEFVKEINMPGPSWRPYPYSVVDMDPRSGSVLLIDVWDAPFFFLTSWYLYNLQTEQLTKIGRVKGYAFFLGKDVLNQAP